MRFKEYILNDSNGNPLIKTFHSQVAPCTRPYNEHHHTECELSVFISGNGIYSVHEKTYEFQPGDMFLFGSNEAHCITKIHKELNLLNIHFEPRLLWENPENIELLGIFNARNNNFSNMLSHTDETLKNMLLNIEKEISEKKTGFNIQIKYMLFSALIHIIREYNCTKSNDLSSSNFSATEKLKEAMLYIDNNLENKITLKDIANVACMTQTYFSSLFKQFNGISPWEYIIIKRVEMAVKMLKTTNMTKLEIAEKCGFNSSSNFYKEFKKITGKNPKDFSQG